MSPKKLLVTAGAIAVAAGAAILIPGVAAGTPLTLVPASSVVAPHTPPGDEGNGGGEGNGADEGGGNAWGHHKDDPGFPGNNGRGHDKDSPGDDDTGGDDSDTGDGNAWGHHKDDPGFPGNNGRGRDKGSTDD